MRRTLLSTLAVAGLLGGLAGALPVTPAPTAAAQEDLAKEARLLTASGKFKEADDVLKAAPEEVRNDVKLRLALGDLATKWTRRQQGQEKVPGLIAAREHFAKAVELQPDDVDAATEALDAALQLVEIQIEAKQPERAKEHADWAVKIGESVLEGGANTTDLRLAVARARDHRAKLSHKIQDFDSIVVDYSRSADLLVGCAEEAKKPAEALGAAARVYLDLALFIAEGRPIEEEKRDDEALVKAYEAAKRACEMKDADKDQYTIHLLVLRELYRAKVEGEFDKPYMQELGKREGIDGLEIHVPKADGWKRIEKSGDWDLFLERKLEGDDTAVQLMVRVYSFSESFGGKTWDRVEDTTKLRYEDQKSNDFSEVVKDVAPTQIDMGRKGPEIWHFELSGTADNRRRWISEYTMLRSKKDKKTYHIRIIDWRVSPDLGEPDIVAFVEQAFGMGEDDDKKKKGGRKKR